MMARRRGWLVAAAVGLVWAADAYAWRPSSECNGRVSRWEDGPALFRLHPRWGDPATDWGRAFVRAMSAWNDVAGAHGFIDWRREARLDRFDFTNGRSEAAVVRQGDIDGAAGLTHTRRETCPDWWWSWWPINGKIIETDVMIAGDMGEGMYTRSVPNCDEYNGNAAGHGDSARDARAWNLTREATMIHEFGHAMGLGHEDHAMTLMMTSGGEGRYCGTPQFAPHPDEISAMQAIYGDRQVEHDLAASSMRYHSVDRVDMTMEREAVEGCAGRLVEMRWSVAHRGTEPMTYDVWWYASEAPYAADLLLKVERGRRIEPGRFETHETSVRISRAQSPETPYYVSFVVVPAEGVEMHRDNNLSYTATRIVRRRPEECR